MTDHLVVAALILAVAVTGVAAGRSADSAVSLPRAERACARTHDASEVVHDPLPEGGSVQRLVSVPVCDAWVRR